ncbi:hypothetical protein GGP70_000510 [Salinibacter ruber]|nr:hypothetical protein [Salinibacter ruber]
MQGGIHNSAHNKTLGMHVERKCISFRTICGVASIILCKADGGLTGIEAEWKRATAAC